MLTTDQWVLEANGIPNPLYQPACSGTSAKPSYILKRVKFSQSGGGEGTLRERCHSASAHLVAGTTCSMEWQGPPPQTTDCDHHLGCLSHGVGSSLQWFQDRGSLEPLGAGDAYQLSGVASSNPGGEDLSEGLDRFNSPIAAGQPDCSGVHQQHGGHSVSPTHRPGQSPVGVGPVQGHCADCRVYTRDGEHCSRCRVQIHDRQDGLEVAHQGVPADRQEMGTTGDGPICNSSDHTTALFLQLEARPTGRGDMMLSARIGARSRVMRTLHGV